MEIQKEERSQRSMVLVTRPHGFLVLVKLGRVLRRLFCPEKLWTSSQCCQLSNFFAIFSEF